MSIATTKEMAQNMGIAPTTVREWVRQFSVPTKKRKGKMVYDDEARAVLETIQRLKANDAGMQTIKRKIEPFTGISADEHGKNTAGIKDTESEQSIDIAQTIETAVEKAVTKNNDLSEKYARATFEIGQLQERVSHMQNEIDTKNSEIKALPIPLEHEKLKLELQQAHEKNSEKEQAISELNQLVIKLEAKEKELESKLQEEQSKSWFQKLFGK